MGRRGVDMGLPVGSLTDVPAAKTRKPDAQ
jgi:hypothetical protein